mgnify:CR=1 FL=1
MIAVDDQIRFIPEPIVALEQVRHVIRLLAETYPRPSDVARFRDIDDFKQLLLRDKDQLARSLTEKLLAYSTGAAPVKTDRPHVEAIVRRVREQGYGFRTLIHEVVASQVFQSK